MSRKEGINVPARGAECGIITVVGALQERSLTFNHVSVGWRVEIVGGYMTAARSGP
jgi:hypothetical protein